MNGCILVKSSYNEIFIREQAIFEHIREKSHKNNW